MAEATSRSKTRITRKTGSILALKGIVPKLGRTVTIEEMDPTYQPVHNQSRGPAMAAATQFFPEPITMEEYLHTAYHPDCDFVDGRLEERNVGTPKHGLLQMQLGYWFISHQTEWLVRVMSEVRTRVSKTRVRLPDVCVVPMAGAAVGEVRVTPPLLAIEILSPDDRMNRVIERLDDFLAMGVENLWVLDPEERTAYTYTASGLKLVKTPVLRLPESPVYLNLAELFAALDC